MSPTSNVRRMMGEGDVLITTGDHLRSVCVYFARLKPFLVTKRSGFGFLFSLIFLLVSCNKTVDSVYVLPLVKDQPVYITVFKFFFVVFANVVLPSVSCLCFSPKDEARPSCKRAETHMNLHISPLKNAERC